ICNLSGQLKSATAISKSDSQLKVDKESTVQQETNVKVEQQRGGFRKLLMRISEKIGTTEKTEYTKCFNDMCKEVDEYRVIIEDIAQQLISTLQQDPRYVPKPPGKMEVEAPPQEDPFELLQLALKITGNQMESKKEVEQIQTSALKLASLHREYQQKGRRAIHNIRTFINVDYENIRDARNMLEKFRQELDFAKYELKGAKTPETIQVNNALYVDALKNFQKQLCDTESMLKKLPETREKHRIEILKFFQLMRKYHQHCANATILSI
uniref:BAR domain-containing protein n=1 Tax=Wuchereria bancrofti TaxID=6293 RepID=A0A1I8F0Z1_WUCBA